MKRSASVLWAARVARWKASGLTAKEFAKKKGLNAGSLLVWSSKLRSASTGRKASKAKEAAPPKPSFVELATAQPGPPWSSRLTLTVSRRYEVQLDGAFDERTLTRLLTVLESRS